MNITSSPLLALLLGALVSFPTTSSAEPTPTTYNYIAFNEGHRNYLYEGPAGYELIGYGRNLRTRGLSDDEVKYLLINDIEHSKKELDRLIPWWRELTYNHQLVLVDLVHQIGGGGLMKFKRFIYHLKNNNPDMAAAELLNSQAGYLYTHRFVRNAKLVANDWDETRMLLLNLSLKHFNRVGEIGE